MLILILYLCVQKEYFRFIYTYECCKTVFFTRKYFRYEKSIPIGRVMQVIQSKIHIIEQVRLKIQTFKYSVSMHEPGEMCTRIHYTHSFRHNGETFLCYFVLLKCVHHLYISIQIYCSHFYVFTLHLPEICTMIF